MAADQTISSSDAPTIPVAPQAPAGPGEEPTLPLADAAPAGTTLAVERNRPASPAGVAPKPATWSGRVVVPSASGPGRTKAAVPPAPTRAMARVNEPEAADIGTRWTAPVPRRRGSGAGRFFTALFAVVLLLAVPVVSAYVAYKLASGENPFDWPPTMDLSKVF